MRDHGCSFPVLLDVSVAVHSTAPLKRYGNYPPAAAAEAAAEAERLACAHREATATPDETVDVEAPAAAEEEGAGVGAAAAAAEELDGCEGPARVTLKHSVDLNCTKLGFCVVTLEVI